MATFLFANNAGTTLAAPINSGATLLTVASGFGDEFPNPSAGQQFVITLTDVTTGALTEIMYCTARSGDDFTVLRAQEDTVAQSWAAGDLVNALITAGVLAAMEQTSTLFPSRIVTASGPFVLTTADANGGVGLNRTAAPSASSTTLPANAQPGQLYAIEDLAKNFNAFPVDVNAPFGMTIAGLPKVTLNVNGQCGYFRYYGSNIWSYKP